MVDFLNVNNPSEVDLLGLTHNENYIVYKYNNDDCNIFFSASRKGNAITAHFSSDKSGLRLLKIAINKFCEFLPTRFPWCEMVFAMIGKDSIGRLITKCNFELLTYNDKCKVFVRVLR